MSVFVAPPRQRHRVRDWLANPWGKARFLWVLAIAYVVWIFVPVVQAVIFSFNSGRSITQWQGFSLRWYITGSGCVGAARPGAAACRDPDLKLSLLTAVIAVPLGVLFAIGLHRWRGVSSRSSNFMMMFSFVTPELILAVALFLLFNQAFRSIGTGPRRKPTGLMVLSVAYPVVIVRARLLSLGPLL